MKRLHNKSVLVIEDDSGMLCALDKVLTGEGATTIPVTWVGDAVEILSHRQQPIDLVITDLRMPVLNGLTAAYAIHEVFPKLPVIVLTAYGSSDVKAECFRQGVAAFLEKPLNTEQLLNAIEEVFASRKGAP